MSRLHARLRRLEVVAQPANSICAVCGHGPGVVPRIRLEQEHEVDDSPDMCTRCGTLLRLRLTFDPSD